MDSVWIDSSKTFFSAKRMAVEAGMPTSGFELGRNRIGVKIHSMNICIYIYIYMCTCVYMYTFIHRFFSIATLGIDILVAIEF